MNDDASKPHNIFEAASRLEKERRAKKEEVQAPQPFAGPGEDSSLSAIFQRCRQLHKEIAESLEQAFKRGGITSSQVQQYVSRPQNFSERDWQQIEAQKKKNEEMLLALKEKIGGQLEGEQAPPPEAKKEEPPPPSPPQPPEEQKPSSPQEEEKPPPTPPRKKPKIVTRRHWIGM